MCSAIFVHLFASPLYFEYTLHTKVIFEHTIPSPTIGPDPGQLTDCSGGGY